MTYSVAPAATRPGPVTVSFDPLTTSLSDGGGNPLPATASSFTINLAAAPTPEPAAVVTCACIELGLMCLMRRARQHQKSGD